MSSPNPNDLSALNGNFKKQFHDKVEELIPEHVILQKGMVDWVPSEKQNGEFYAIPTLLRSNQGVTYLGEGGTVQALKDPKPAVMKEAQVKGSELNVRGQLTYKALSQASAAGPKAFKKASAWLVEDLASVAFTRIEIAALYGQSGLGTVSTVTNVSGTTYDVVITSAEFAPGIWVLLEGATVEFYSGLVSGTSTIRANSTNILGTISTVTTSTKTVRIAFSVANSGGSAVVGGDVIFFEGAATNSAGTLNGFNEMVGLYAQLNATSGTLFNIDRGAYSLMQGNVYTSTGALTKAKVIQASMLAVDKGQLSSLVCLVGTAGFAALHAEDMALRMFDSSYSEATGKSGSKELVYTSVNGQIKVVVHPLVKAGHAMMFNPDEIIWCGSSKPTFEIPGMSEQFFRLVDGYNAVELQNYADLAIYVIKPSRTVLMTGIT